MDLADTGKQEGCGGGINIDISLIMGKMGGMSHDDQDGDKGMPPDMKLDDECVDWKSIAKQLLQAVSMMDTHTDGVEEGTEEPEGALKAIDNETSRVLWGKQEDDNPMSSYQNANYGKTTANGLVMTNPAVTCNNAAYGENDPDNDGDVDILKGREIDTGKDEPHGGFRKAAENVIQRSGGKSNEKREDKKASGSDNSFGKSERESGSKEEEPESKESEVK